MLFPNGDRIVITDDVAYTIDDAGRRLGLIFQQRVKCVDLECQSSSFAKALHHLPYNVVTDLMDNEFYYVHHPRMKCLFPDWPRTTIEEWAVDFNHSFMLKFSSYMEPQLFGFIVHIKAFGLPNVEWDEYTDKFYQAATMEKLRKDL